jgi:hypothetical protein
MSETIDLPMNTPALPPEQKPPIAGQPPRSASIAVSEKGVQLTNVQDMLIFAKAIVDANMAPKGIDTQQKVMIAIQMGLEIGLSPMMALQNIAIVNGRPSIYGTAGKALLRRHGFDIEEMDLEDIREKAYARCTITHPRQKPVTRTFSIEAAKEAGLWDKSGPWKQYPDRMLQWKAFWLAARDGAADVLHGLHGFEDVQDYPAEPKNVTPSLSDLDKPAP